MAGRGGGRNRKRRPPAALVRAEPSPPTEPSAVERQAPWERTVVLRNRRIGVPVAALPVIVAMLTKANRGVEGWYWPFLPLLGTLGILTWTLPRLVLTHRAALVKNHIMEYEIPWSAIARVSEPGTRLELFLTDGTVVPVAAFGRRGLHRGGDATHAIKLIRKRMATLGKRQLATGAMTHHRQVRLTSIGWAIGCVAAVVGITFWFRSWSGG